MTRIQILQLDDDCFIPIPEEFLEELGMQEDDEVEIEFSSKHIIIKPNYGNDESPIE